MQWFNLGFVVIAIVIEKLLAGYHTVAYIYKHVKHWSNWGTDFLICSDKLSETIYQYRIRQNVKAARYSLCSTVCSSRPLWKSFEVTAVFFSSWSVGWCIEEKGSEIMENKILEHGKAPCFWLLCSNSDHNLWHCNFCSSRIDLIGHLMGPDLYCSSPTLIYQVF